jgi:hypothetical protein
MAVEEYMNKKHIFFMLACCLLPLLIYGAIFLLKIPANTVLLAVMVLLCPIAHLLMTRFLLHEHRGTNQPKLVERPKVV